MLPADLLARWHLSNPIKIAHTASSTVWMVQRADGQPAVLKLLHPGEADEARGADYLQSLNGQGAVQVYARDGNAILMEFCPGPPLGDLARSGKDIEADDILCDVILKLHGASAPVSELQPLEIRFAPLTTPALTGELATAADIARTLLATPVPPVALHGDLHHDNILDTPRGWLAIDPKGVAGDPAYETANAFRNPEGAGALIFDPDRIALLAQRFSQRLDQPRPRLLAWAAAHCALSIVWSREDGKDCSDDLRLLPILLASAAAPD
jgi:streptomycin 6-kinase